MTDSKQGPGRPSFRDILREAAQWSQLRDTPYGAGPAVMIASISFLQTFDTAAFAIAQPDIVRELQVEVRDVLAIVQFVGFFAVFGALLIGWWADRVRRVPLYLGGAIGSGVFSVATAGAGSAFTLGLPRVLDEVSEKAAEVPERSLLADYYPFEVRGKAFALVGSMQQIGRVLALPLGGAAITFLGLRWSFLLFGAPLVVLGIVGFARLREPTRGYFERTALGAPEEVAQTEDEPRSFGEGWRTAWSIRTLKRMFVGYMVVSLGVLAFFVLFPFFLAEVYGLNAFERGLVGVPSAVAALAGGFLGGGLVDAYTRHHPRRAITVFGAFVAVAALALGVVAVQPPLLVLVAAVSVFYFGVSLVGPAMFAVTSQVVPADVRTQALQIFNLAQLPALLFGIQLAFLIYDTYGWTTTFAVAVPVMVVGALLITTAAPFYDLDRRSAFAAALASEEWRRTRTAGEGKLLVCRDVTVDYQGVRVLFGVDFDVEEGEIVALLGTNGAGKSTLLRAISGTHEASGGAILFDGRDITHMPPHEVARRGVIHVPGGRGIFPGLTVRENLQLGAWMADGEADVDERLAEVQQLFPALATRGDVSAGDLSGGEQQQLALAQAMLGHPRLLVIDELSLGLSPAIVAELLNKVREIHRKGTTVVLVEQSVNVALSIADRVVFMEKGEVRFTGPAASLLDRPDILRSAYVHGGTGVATAATPPPGTTDARPILEVEGLAKRYGGVAALEGVSFEVREGEVLGLIGPNGSGKTTLFDVISGAQQPDAGTVRYDGEDVTALMSDARAQRGLIRRFQDARLFPSLTVFETLLVALDRGLEVRSSVANAMQLPSVRRSERRARHRADDLIALLELGPYRDKFVKELSTGLRRVVDLAVTLAARPKLLLLDEPAAGVAQAEAENFAPLLRRVRHETGCTILVIEHDMPLLVRLADELLALDAGRLLVKGAPRIVLDDERVVRSYLGESEVAVQRSGGMP